jgi:uncharacterized RDD family membrane protein YckC
MVGLRRIHRCRPSATGSTLPPPGTRGLAIALRVARPLLVPTGYASTVDDDRRSSPEPGDPAPRSGPIRSAGVGNPPVDWAAPGSEPKAGGVEVGQGLVLAGIGTRIAAFLVDVFLLGGLAIAITLIASRLTPDRATVDLLAAAVVAILGVAYFAISWLGPWAATPGQRLGGLRVVDATSLGRIDARRAILRSFALGAALSLLSFPAAVSRYVEVIAVVWAMILLGSVIFNGRHQGLHDRWARTLVVRPIRAATGPLAIGCFLIVLLILLAPFVVATASGPLLKQVLDQLPSPVPQ